MEKPKEKPNKQSITTQDLEQAGIDLNLFDQDFLIKTVNEYLKKNDSLDIKEILERIKTLGNSIRKPGERSLDYITLSLSNHPDFAEVRNGRYRILFYKYKGSETQGTRYYCVYIGLEKDITHINLGKMQKLLTGLRSKVHALYPRPQTQGSAFGGKKGKEG